MILKGFEVGPFMSNCYIVGSEETREAMIIDPGADAEAILDKVRELGLTVKLVVLTHTHTDHIGGVRRVKEATGAQFALHHAESSPENFRPSPLVASLGITFDPPPPPDRLLNEGEVLEVGELRFKVLHTPGHSPGGICLEGHGVVFSGDTLFNFGIGRTDFPGGSFEQLMDSIQEKLMTLPDDTVVLPGHGPQTTVETERRFNPFLGG